eukprot:6190641-Pleurochrysis_carterae.AAC.2
MDGRRPHLAADRLPNTSRGGRRARASSALMSLDPTRSSACSSRTCTLTIRSSPLSVSRALYAPPACGANLRLR